MAKLIELRFFGGLSVEEMGEMLGRTPVMVRRDLRAARALMARALGGDEWTLSTSGS
jgi:DNA-directed RNA polymerase specialized sigma24 family protein